MKVLCVAEKNDAAKNIAALWSKGTCNRREGISKYNKIYEFTSTLNGQNAQFVMTSASGHLMNYQFDASFKNWSSVSPQALFSAPMQKHVTKEMINIKVLFNNGSRYNLLKKTLEREVRGASLLIVWTDCDREGENIGAEIRDICVAIKPRIRVLRAHFSEITASAVRLAINSLTPMDERIVQAVDTRQELDLRIGASFTRLQSLFLQKKFPIELGQNLISYGSCQFPTLGFIVERYNAIQQFQVEPFWRIEMKHERNGCLVNFTWLRGRLFSRPIVQAIYTQLSNRANAQVVNIKTQPKSRWRPTPLETVELEKKARMLGASAKTIMACAEKLYTRGFISYPRTETNIFPDSLPLAPLVQTLTSDNRYGQFAQNLLETGINPRQGKKSDQAHPPIHPLKPGAGLTGLDAQVHEFIARRFLACLSSDAKGSEVTVTVQMFCERFEAKGLTIHERGFLDVYPYEKWGDKHLPRYTIYEDIQPQVAMTEGQTQAPRLLSESDLIGLMDKYGIGTDATHADHIETIKNRGYCNTNNENRFHPNPLGIALCTVYADLAIPLAGHQLRASLEIDLKRIETGELTKQQVLEQQLQAYEQAYIKVDRSLDMFYQRMTQFYGAGNTAQVNMPSGRVMDAITKCPTCQSPMRPNTLPSGVTSISCGAYPNCKSAYYLPRGATVKERRDQCQRCSQGHFKAVFNFPRGSDVPPHMFGEYCACIKCDRDLSEIITKRIAPPGSSGGGGGGGGGAGGGGAPPRAPPRSGGSGSAPRSTSQKRKSDDFGTSHNKRRPSTSSSSGGGGVVKCKCNVDAASFITQKEGPNKGRAFFSCANNKQCNFFEWADNEQRASVRPSSSSSSSSSQPSMASSSNSSSSGQRQCACSQPATQQTVRKEGPNQGRPFYACANNRACNFFEWADNGTGAAATGNRSQKGGPRKAPTCSQCGQSGHTKRTCNKK